MRKEGTETVLTEQNKIKLMYYIYSILENGIRSSSDTNKLKEKNVLNKNPEQQKKLKLVCCLTTSEQSILKRSLYFYKPFFLIFFIIGRILYTWSFIWPIKRNPLLFWGPRRSANWSASSYSHIRKTLINVMKGRGV